MDQNQIQYLSVEKWCKGIGSSGSHGDERQAGESYLNVVNSGKYMLKC